MHIRPGRSWRPLTHWEPLHEGELGRRSKPSCEGGEGGRKGAHHYYIIVLTLPLAARCSQDAHWYLTVLHAMQVLETTQNSQEHKQ